MARGLKFRIWGVKGLYYLCSENKGADQLRGYREADLRLCFSIRQKAGFLTMRLICLLCQSIHFQNIYCAIKLARLAGYNVCLKHKHVCSKHEQTLSRLILTYSTNELCREKNLSLGFPTRSNTNRAVQPQKMARGLKFWI